MDLGRETKAGNPHLPSQSYHSLLHLLTSLGPLIRVLCLALTALLAWKSLIAPSHPAPTPTSSRPFIVCAPEHPRSPNQHVCRCLTLAPSSPVSLSHPKFTASDLAGFCVVLLSHPPHWHLWQSAANWVKVRIPRFTPALRLVAGFQPSGLEDSPTSRSHHLPHWEGEGSATPSQMVALP